MKKPQRKPQRKPDPYKDTEQCIRSLTAIVEMLVDRDEERSNQLRDVRNAIGRINSRPSPPTREQILGSLSANMANVAPVPTRDTTEEEIRPGSFSRILGRIFDY